MAKLVNKCKEAVCFFHSLWNKKQMLMLDKIFTTVSMTAFVHVRRCNQHKMKSPRSGFKYFNISYIYYLV